MLSYVIPKTQKWNSRIIPTSCISKDNFEEVGGELDRDTKWNMKLPCNLSQTEFLQLKCTQTKAGLKQIMPTLPNAPEPIIYHVCMGTNYCAMKRQATSVAYPDQAMLTDFEQWFEVIFETEIKPLLTGFQYSYDGWYNHLTAAKQAELSKIDLSQPVYDNSYEMFVKSEKQLYENGKAPKNRCICSPNTWHKYVLGPVTYKLEKLFKNFKGYCGGKNWDELQLVYKQNENCGYTSTIQLDGSGFDRSQHLELKQIVDYKIYKFVAPYVHHVDKKLFDFYSQPIWRKIKCVITVTTAGGKKKKQNMGSILQRGKTFSGSMDTSLMNTLRMALYNRYTLERVAKIKTWNYSLLCKGDDSAVFIKPQFLKQALEAYDKTFTRKKTGIHGLGQIAKFIKTGDISDIDFCSTQTYKDTIGNFHIVRKWDRYLTLTPWSRKALSLSKDELKVYKRSLYESNLAWCKGLILFESFNEFLKEDLTNIKVKLKSGQTKLFSDTDSYKDIDLNYYFSKDEYYANKTRISTTESDEFAYTQMLANKHNINEHQIITFAAESLVGYQSNTFRL